MAEFLTPSALLTDPLRPYEDANYLFYGVLFDRLAYMTKKGLIQPVLLNLWDQSEWKTSENEPLSHLGMAYFGIPIRSLTDPHLMIKLVSRLKTWEQPPRPLAEDVQRQFR